MCSFSFSTNINCLDELVNANYYQQKRGPDYISIVKEKDFVGIHNLLHITGEKTEQPYSYKDTFTFFNGEIYNYKKFNTDNDTKSIPLFLEEKNYYSSFDGEFSVLNYNRKTKQVLFFKDIFGTKPLFYSIFNGDLYVSSLKSALEFLPPEKVFSCDCNTIYTFNITDKTLVKEENVFSFDLKQHKTNFKDFEQAMTNSILKRLPKIKTAVGLSGGIDSGVIACILKNKSNVLYISISNNENNLVLKKRKQKLTNIITKKLNFKEGLKLKLTYLKSCEPIKYCNYNYLNDASFAGLCYIGNTCNQKNVKTYLSGTGSDEIISDYGFDGTKLFSQSCFGGLFPEKLEDIYPWHNFFNGTMKSYIEKEEIILGSFGIETRYPFLDKHLVQEFLWLDKELKNKEYKYPLTNFLTSKKYPFNIEKRGFNCNR
jgi:asparagine synthase (glutamine-hydrolysing)